MSTPKFPDNPEISREDAINQILTSIAMEELGISHILNAEGEKIQYSLGTLPGADKPGGGIEDVLKVNDSVIATLEAVTGTQQALSEKMKTALSAGKEPGSTGEQGPPGDKGPTGDKGSAGDKGPAGDKGQTGDKGPAGDKGPTGDKGPQGEQGQPGSSPNKASDYGTVYTTIGNKIISVANNGVVPFTDKSNMADTSLVGNGIHINTKGMYYAQFIINVTPNQSGCFAIGINGAGILFSCVRFATGANSAAAAGGCVIYANANDTVTVRNDSGKAIDISSEHGGYSAGTLSLFKIA